MQRSVLCRSRRELSHEYLLAKLDFDTAENEPSKVCPLSAYRSRSPRYSMIASTLERARSPSPDGSEKSVDSGHSSSKRTDISRISASPYDYLMFQRLKETYAPNVHDYVFSNLDSN